MSRTRRTTAVPVSVSRMRWVLAAVLALLLVLVGRLVYVQGIDPGNTAKAALANRTTTVQVPAVRGQILDENGKVLATSSVRYNLTMDQRQLKKNTVTRKKKGSAVRENVPLDQALTEVGAALGKDQAEMRRLIVGVEGEKKKGYVILAKSVTPEVKDAVMAVGVPGLRTEQNSVRSYPNGQVAGPVLGFLNADGAGAEGLELSQQSHLAGTPGELVYERGRDGTQIPGAAITEKPAKDGQSVRLTIDADVQFAAQEAVMAKREQFNAQWVNAVVMDVKTGKILALADSTSMDPNDPGATDAKYRTSTTVTQAFEPGSTGKAPTFALALQQGKVKPTDEFTVPNHLEMDGEVINDSLKHATFQMTTAGIMARSYNTGTIQVGDKLTDQDRYDFMRELGVGSKLNIGLPGASSGILLKPDQWERRQRLTTMFGQGYTQTALHTASIFQGLGNDGVQISPRLIDAYIDPDGTEHPVEPEKTQRVISAETSKELRRIMETVVTDGTSKKMAIPGYRVGGKSGTAQAQGEDGKFNKHTSSFVGMAPIDDPRYLVVVTMQHPQGDWKSWSVGDTFVSIMSTTLGAKNVPPSSTEPNPYKVFVGDQQNQGW